MFLLKEIKSNAPWKHLIEDLNSEVSKGTFEGKICKKLNELFWKERDILFVKW